MRKGDGARMKEEGGRMKSRPVELKLSFQDLPTVHRIRLKLR